jgi:hypothetical protein
VIENTPTRGKVGDNMISSLLNKPMRSMAMVDEMWFAMQCDEYTYIMSYAQRLSHMYHQSSSISASAGPDRRQQKKKKKAPTEYIPK